MSKITPITTVKMENNAKKKSLGDEINPVNENPETRFMLNHIRCRECESFTERPDQQNINDAEKLCYCNYTKAQHLGVNKSIKDSKWSHITHARPIPTNAFGEIEFVGYGDNHAKFVRVDVETKMDTMLNLLQQAWGMEKPNLLISVTGGAKNFTMKSRLRDVFRRGLIKAAQSTGAWIVTGGTNAGVMKHVGEAVRDFGLTSERKVTTIGIAPWGCVQNKELLINKEGQWPAYYRIENEAKPKQSFLDPNHSHFILVDNGTQQQFTVEIPFRAKLEEKIGNQKTDTGTDAVSVPVCLLVLEGGPGTLETVNSAISSNTPTIIIKGSGKTADILAYAYQNSKEEEITKSDQNGLQVKGTISMLEPHIMADIRTMIKSQFGDQDLDKRVDWIKNSCSKRDLITVFELDSKNSAKDVDLAILKALLKANKNQVMDQLKLALAWNRIDVAKSEIFTDEKVWPTGMLDDVMLSAIKLNRVDFVELFLDHGVSLKEFLTVERLVHLYNSIPQNCLLYTLLRSRKKQREKAEHKSNFTLADVGYLIQELLGDFYVPTYLTNRKLHETADHSVSGLKNNDMNHNSDHLGGRYYFPNPAQELFIWSVLMNNHKLSKLFWVEGKECSTAACLFANSILNSLQAHTFDAQVKAKFQMAADDYGQLAIGVINNCYSSDEKRTHKLLVYVMPQWGWTTCVLMAIKADNKEFIAQTACQSLLNKLWMGKMTKYNSLLSIVPAIVMPPLIQVLIDFQKKNKPKELSADFASGKEKDLKRQQTVYSLQPQVLEKPAKFNLNDTIQKWAYFYSSPIVKFITNVVFYLVFLMLYSYVLVVKLTSEFVYQEGILIVWVATIFTEELRQFFTGAGHSLKSQIESYFSDKWNWLDMFSIFLFIVGMILRAIPNDDTLSAARVILSINLITFFSRILHIFSINQELGPKLVMINRMIQDLKWFVVILLVFIMAYAVASEAVLYPNSELSWKLLYYFPRKAYWHIYGELFLDDIEGSSTCTDDPTQYSDYDVLRCPSPVGKYFVPILLGLYILMTNVLLLNLLIAMFSFTFQQIQDNTDMHWCFQRFNLVLEYTERPVLPPPMIILSHIYLVFQYCCRRSPDQQAESSEFRKVFKNKDFEKKLMQWEDIIADNFLSIREKTERNSLEGRVKASLERLEVVLSRIDDLHDNQTAALGLGPPVPMETQTQSTAQIEKKMAALENQMVHTTKALEWIMSSLQENKLASKTQRPTLPDYSKVKLEELKKKQAQDENDKKVVQELLQKKKDFNFMSRTSPYPATTVQRQKVPDEMVQWEIDYPDYNPPAYTSSEILRKPSFADDDLLSTPVRKKVKIDFNEYDKQCKVSRQSLLKPYKVVDGLPLNPVGRTGLKGRGSLGRWGPNHAGDPVVTRWKLLENGTCAKTNGKPVLEFVAVQRLDNNLWALPGGICEPDVSPWSVLKTDFKESSENSPVNKEEIEKGLADLSQSGVEVYRGYADDPRNTDNAWIETRVVNYHDKDGKVLQHVILKAREAVHAVTWQTVSSSLTLHGAHAYFLKLVADRHGAAF
ncbi:transient receptor potential cation channel subfamily M member-like 2 isoform X2 [Physella acuta]|uniref:transient receptor potential cation channel subfamily M member-like 2 isoform X2 n=1 Tax=Physella acuta TaxID=109671 RepID=UPI0027DD7FCA|nr:transient receptor potential cation channel subfamily M member-like 2 isoform X2 [Physella acuta]